MSELNGPARPRTRRPRASAKNVTQPPVAVLPTRLDTLREALVSCVELLKQRRANLIPPADIDAFIELDWMTWEGGNLALTLTGGNICRQAKARTGSAHG